MEAWPATIEGLRVKLETALRLRGPALLGRVVNRLVLDEAVEAMLDRVLIENDEAALQAMAKQGPAWLAQAAENLWACHLKRPPRMASADMASEAVT